MFWPECLARMCSICGAARGGGINPCGEAVVAYVRSAGRRSLRRFIADHNPFYLLSAVLMLLGCLLLSNTMTWSPIALRKLLILIATLNVYELLLVGLGLYLIVKRTIASDGLMLLALEALFIVDVGFLNSELYQESLPVGLAVNLGLLALDYLLSAGGTGYFRSEVVRPYLEDGRLRLVERAPRFSYSIYAV